MAKKILLFSGGITIALFLLLMQSQTVLAREGECHLKHCLVPSPTILMPADNATVNTARPVIRGLSWKTALVRVYIDGRELANVQFKKHEDYYGSFYVVPDFDLTPGDHYIYTIAHTEKPGWYDQSQESIYVDITVKITVAPRPVNRPLAKAPVASEPLAGETAVLPALPELPLEKLAGLFPPTGQDKNQGALEPLTLGDDNTAPQNPQIINDQNRADDFSVLNQPSGGQVEIKEGEIEGGVSVEEKDDAPQPNLQEAVGLSDLGELLRDEFAAQNYQSRAQKNRLIGLVMLAVILVGAVIWLAVKKQRKLKRQRGGDEGYLPPPPQPRSATHKSQRTEGGSEAGFQHNQDDEITIEPITEEADDELAQALEEDVADNYWAAPPLSPHTPYPEKRKTDETDGPKNDLGV